MKRDRKNERLFVRSHGFVIFGVYIDGIDAVNRGWYKPIQQVFENGICGKVQLSIIRRVIHVRLHYSFEKRNSTGMIAKEDGIDIATVIKILT